MLFNDQETISINTAWKRSTFKTFRNEQEISIPVAATRRFVVLLVIPTDVKKSRKYQEQESATPNNFMSLIILL